MLMRVLYYKKHVRYHYVHVVEYLRILLETSHVFQVLSKFQRRNVKETSFGKFMQF